MTNAHSMNLLTCVLAALDVAQDAVEAQGEGRPLPATLRDLVKKKIEEGRAAACGLQRGTQDAEVLGVR